MPATRAELAKTSRDGRPITRESMLAALPDRVAGKEKAKELIERTTGDENDAEIVDHG